MPTLSGLMGGYSLGGQQGHGAASAGSRAPLLSGLRVGFIPQTVLKVYDGVKA